MAVPVYLINLLLDTNFMFLMYAEPGNPLLLFEQYLGHHLWGLPHPRNIVDLDHVPHRIAHVAQKENQINDAGADVNRSCFVL